MPWKRSRIREDIKTESRWLLWCVLMASFVFTVFGFLHWRVFFPKLQPTTRLLNEFGIKTGNFGDQSYRVSVQKFTYDGIGKILPTLECDDLMVIDLKYRLQNKEVLIKKLEGLSGVVKVRSAPYRMVIDRPCIASEESGSLWTWDEIWSKIKKEMEKHFAEPPRSP